MDRLRRAVVLALILLTPLASAAPRRRAAAAPGGPGLPSAWLDARAQPLASATPIADRSDLAPLGTLASTASIVALGDSTHATREFFTIKLRVLEMLVRDHGFDVLSLEMPFPIAERINVWASGGDGNIRALLDELDERLNYFFWNSEELLAVLEWVRAYNLTRGPAPPIEIAGADIYDQDGAVTGVLEYLATVDPPAAARAQFEYECVVARDRSDACRSRAATVRATLTAQRDSWIPLTGVRRFDDAVHYAGVVLQYFDGQRYEDRDRNMAANLLWILEHRGTAGKVVHWGHQEHIGRIESSFVRGPSMGTLVGQHLGIGYVAVGTLTGSGSFWQWRWNATTRDYQPLLATFPDPLPGTYEWQFRQHGAAAFFLPLRGYAPPWLAGPAGARVSGTTPDWRTLTESLPAKLDGVFYFDRTGPTRLLR